MVGLSVVLETTNIPMRDSGGVISPKPPHILNKTAVMITASSSSAYTAGFRRESSYSDLGFLEHCSLCRKKLLSGKDIYMYKGGTFCTQDCRSRQIFMDEEESIENSSLVTIKTAPSHSSSSTSSSTSLPLPSPVSESGGNSRRRRGPRSRAGGFAY